MYQDHVQSFGINTGDGPEPSQEPEPDTGSESKHGTPEPWNGPPPLTDIEFRIKELHNRHFLLLMMQRFMKKTEDDGVGTTEGMACEDSDQLCELEAIQKELEMLLVRKEKLEKQGNRSKLRANKGEQGPHPTFYKAETPRGGVYMLPCPELPQEDFTLEHRVKTSPAAETPIDSVIPVDFLRQTPALTKCPSCEEIVFTETCSRVGQTPWTICVLCALTGCVAGCCLIPFCMSHLRDVHHQCPRCRAKIHKHQPL